MPTAPVISEDLLAPISADKPAGDDLRPTPEWDKIKEARRSEDTGNLGVWKPREVKTADWFLVGRLAGEALARRTKDLQVALWLTEASLKLHGFAGLRDSMRLIRELLLRFWDSLYPPIEDGDLDFRSGLLEWLNEKMAFLIREIPITARQDGGEDYSYHKYLEARQVGSERDFVSPNGDLDQPRKERRESDLARGLISMEMYGAAVHATRRARYEEVCADFEEACRELQELDRVLDQKFGAGAPPLTASKSALEDLRGQIERVLDLKREEEPDPEPAVAAEEAEAALAGGVRIGLPVEPQDRDDAVRRIAGVAAWLRQNDPAGPAAYLLPRALRWGELRAGGNPPAAALLAAPATEVRQRLRQLFLDGNWTELLEQAEQAAAHEEGRAWLDLQRYSLTALANLGYEGAAAALRGQLRLLLEDYPDLPQKTLSDDTPAANAETQSWLDSATRPPGAAEAPVGSGETDDAWEAARKTVHSGRVQEGLAEMSRLAAAEATGRARFHRKLLLAETCLSIQRPQLALPILEELAEQIDRYQLEGWESTPLVGRVWRRLYGCYRTGDGESGQEGRAAKLFARLCRLDPSQALMCTEKQGEI